MIFQKGQKIITKPYLCDIPKYGIKDTDMEIGEVIEANEKSIIVKWFDRQLGKYVELDYNHNECGDFSLADKDEKVGVKIFNPPAELKQAHVSGRSEQLVCPACNGKGYEIWYDGYEIIKAVEMECKRCGGTGQTNCR